MFFLLKQTQRIWKLIIRQLNWSFLAERAFLWLVSIRFIRYIFTICGRREPIIKFCYLIIYSLCNFLMKQSFGIKRIFRCSSWILYYGSHFESIAMKRSKPRPSMLPFSFKSTGNVKIEVFSADTIRLSVSTSSKKVKFHCQWIFFQEVPDFTRILCFSIIILDTGT